MIKNLDEEKKEKMILVDHETHTKVKIASAKEEKTIKKYLMDLMDKETA